MCPTCTHPDLTSTGDYIFRGAITSELEAPIFADVTLNKLCLLYTSIALIQRVDTESRFLGREPGEFDFTPDRERELIEGMLTAERERWFVAEYEGEIVGQ